MLAFAFVLAGLVETFAVFGFYGQLSVSASESHVPIAWMVGRTLLGVLLLSALAVERRVPHAREPGREIAIALVVVIGIAYLTSAVYLGTPLAAAIYPSAPLARPWDLFPGALFLAAAVGFGRRPQIVGSAFDNALCAALWMNVTCHIVAAQSSRMLDAPFTVAQVLKVASYAVVLGGTLLDNARLFEQVRLLAVSDSLTGLGNYRRC